MWPRGNHKPAAQSRVRVFSPAERRQTGCDLSPLVDAFHPSFPASVEQYISNPCQLNEEAQSIDHLDRRPCHGDRFRLSNTQSPRNSVSVDTCPTRATIDCTGDTHCYGVDSHGDNLATGATGPIFNLPFEVLDLVLSYLSPAALDAARHTSKEWRRRILSSPWALSSVLGGRKKSLPLSASARGEISHRDLLKKLDHVSDLPSTFQHADAWRTRFRTRHIDFSIPLASSPSTRSTLVAATRTGTQNGMVVLQLKNYPQHTTDRSRSTLLIYRFDSTEFPCYAGAVHDVQGQGALRITGMTEIRRHTEWALEIKIGDAVGLYLLTAREAFSNTSARFSFRCLESLEILPRLLKDQLITPEVDGPPESFSNGDRAWKIVASLPPNHKPRCEYSSEGLRKRSESRCLAEQTATGNMYVVGEIGPSQKPSQSARSPRSRSLSIDIESANHFLTGVALLSRPRPTSAFKNIAVAPSFMKNGSIRTAIVWQTADPGKTISELYLYEILEAVYFGPCKACSRCEAEKLFCMVGDLSGDATSRGCRLVQGKRVTSLDEHMGGIHPSSSLYQLASPKSIALGGLDFPHTTENQDAFPRNVQYQKCFVWGPASLETECTQLSMKVLDFSYADPQRLRSFVTHGVGLGWRRDRKFHNIALDSVHCACALHDDGFRVVLPDITTSAKTIKTPEPSSFLQRRIRNTTETAAPATTEFPPLRESLAPLDGLFEWSSFWPSSSWPPPSISAPTTTKTRAPNDQDEPVGSVSKNDTLPRRAALARQQEWLRGRIRGMKRVGLTEFEIAELWNLCVWTRYGLLRKPDGWRELEGEEDRDDRGVGREEGGVCDGGEWFGFDGLMVEE